MTWKEKNVYGPQKAAVRPSKNRWAKSQPIPPSPRPKPSSDRMAVGE